MIAVDLFRRPILSFSKVQRLIGAVLRNQRLQLWLKPNTSRQYLDLGCGWNIHPHVISLDFQWHPGVDLCWDVAAFGIPYPDGSLKGIFSEHCLEHHPFAAAKRLLEECFRVLSPGGVMRLVLPDAERYLRAYVASLDGKQYSFPYPGALVLEGISSPLLAVNRIFYQDRESPNGHCMMYDRLLLESMLNDAGFINIRVEGFRAGRDAALLLDTESRWIESFAIEATKPQQTSVSAAIRE